MLALKGAPWRVAMVNEDALITAQRRSSWTDEG
eukprot:COSAG06_NODE_1119_length_10634_cov_3.222117_18_plen_33_part_00